MKQALSLCSSIAGRDLRIEGHSSRLCDVPINRIMNQGTEL